MPRFKRYKYGEMGARALRQFHRDRPRLIAVDTETEGVAWEARAFCVTLTWKDKSGNLCSCYLDLESDESGTRREVARQMLDGTQVWVFHNAKFDLQKLLLEGVITRARIARARIEDTGIIHALVDENDRHGLKYLAGKILGVTTNEEEVLAKVRRKLKIKKDDGYHLLPREVVVPYAMRDTELTLMLYDALRPFIAARDLHDLYAAELATAIAVLDIEANGIGVDVPYLERTASEYGKKVMRGLLDLQVMSGSKGTFNPNSPKQIIEAFEGFGITITATDKETLSAIDDPFAEALLEYRKNKKLHSTYLLGMLAEQRDGVLHPNFNLTLPRTGRMSSSAASNN